VKNSALSLRTLNTHRSETAALEDKQQAFAKSVFECGHAFTQERLWHVRLPEKKAVLSIDY
jgi:hypothetical protein